MMVALDLDPDKDDATSVGLIDGVFEKAILFSGELFEWAKSKA